MWVHLLLWTKLREYGLHAESRWASLAGKHTPYLQFLSLGMPRYGIQTVSPPASVVRCIKNLTVSRKVEKLWQSLSRVFDTIFPGCVCSFLILSAVCTPRLLLFCSKCPITNLKQIQRATAWRCVPVFVFVQSQDMCTSVCACKAETCVYMRFVSHSVCKSSQKMGYMKLLCVLYEFG